MSGERNLTDKLRYYFFQGHRNDVIQSGNENVNKKTRSVLFSFYLHRSRGLSSSHTLEWLYGA